MSPVIGKPTWALLTALSMVMEPPVTTCCGNTAPSPSTETVLPSRWSRPVKVEAGAPE
jgi:hypothetical protein